MDIEDRPFPLIHPRLIGAGATLLITALITDLFYCEYLVMQWATFSTWLILGGLILALFAAIAFVIELLIHRFRRVAWLKFTLLAVAVLLSIWNELVHTRDGYVSVVPLGVALSAIVTVLLLIAGVRSFSLAAPPIVETSTETVRP